MKRRRKGKQAPPAPGRTTRSEVDRLVDEVIQGMQHLLMRCGYAPEEVADRFAAQLKRIPASVRRQGVRAANDYVDVPHVMSLWANDPAYHTTAGAPRALPARGAEPSIESLASRVDPTLQIRVVMAALRAADVVTKRGRLYLPKTRVYSYRNDPMNLRAHSLRAAKGLLHTLNHNISFRPDQVRWFQYIAENPNVPAGTGAKIYQELFTRGKHYLEAVDDRYVQAEKGAKRGGSRKRVAWHMHYWEEKVRNRTRSAGRSKNKSSSRA